MFPIALARSARADALVDQFGACVRIGRQGVKLLRIASTCRDSQTELARSRSNFGAPLRTCATVRRARLFRKGTIGLRLRGLFVPDQWSD